MNLEEKAHTENDIVPESKIGTDTNSNLNRKDKGKKKVDDLLDTYKPRIPFPLALEAGSLSKQQESQTTKKVVLVKDVNAILLNQLPQKMKDSGISFISCVIGGITFDQGLLDLGASVDLLPMSVYKKLKIEKLKPTSVIL